MSKETYEEMCRAVEKTITDAWAPVFERARAIGLYPLENRATKATKEKLDFLFDNRLAFKVSRGDSKIAVEFDYDEYCGCLVRSSSTCTSSSAGLPTPTTRRRSWRE